MKNRIAKLALVMCVTATQKPVSAMDKQALTAWHAGDTRTALVAVGAGFGGALLAMGAKSSWDARMARARQEKKTAASLLGSSAYPAADQNPDTQSSELVRLRSEYQTLETALMALEKKMQEELQTNAHQAQEQANSLITTLGALSTGVNKRLAALEKNTPLLLGLQAEIIEHQARLNQMLSILKKQFPTEFQAPAIPESSASAGADQFGTLSESALHAGLASHDAGSAGEIEGDMAGIIKAADEK